MAKLCFGGSFNPIHHGHLICARAVAEAKGFERVLLIPSAQPPHKPQQPDMANPDNRLQMCRTAVAGSDFFEVDDLELRRQGPSYTVDTVRELKRRGWERVPWLIGADMLAILPQWHEAEALVQEAELLVMARPGWKFNWSALPEVFRSLRKNVVRAPLIQISATDIRRRVAEGKSIEYFTPPPVCRYVQEHGVYRPA